MEAGPCQWQAYGNVALAVASKKLTPRAGQVCGRGGLVWSTRPPHRAARQVIVVPYHVSYGYDNVIVTIHGRGS